MNCHNRNRTAPDKKPCGLNARTKRKIHDSVMTKRAAPVEVRSGNVRLKIYRGSIKKGRRKYPMFTLAYYENGRRQRRVFGALDAAKAEGEKVAARLDQGERDVLKLTNSDQQSFALVTRELKPTGVPLLDAVRQFVAAHKVLPEGASFLEAVSDYAKRHPAALKPKLLPDVVNEFLAEKEQDGLSGEYLRTLKYHLHPLRDRFKTPIANVTTGDLEAWLRGLGLSARTRKNFATTIGTLFAFARSRAYLPKSVPTEAEGVSRPKSKGGKIGILTPGELSAIFAAATTDEQRAYFSLAAFTGIRAAELARLEWQDIKLAEGHVEIAASKAKTAARRIVPIVPALAAWLGKVKFGHGKLFTSHRAAERLVLWAGKVIGHWPQNALRHSFISYRVAESQNVNQTALEAGNSAAMIFANYRELVTPAQAAKWFSILPSEPANVVRMKKGRAA